MGWWERTQRGTPRSQSTAARIVPYIPVHDEVQRNVLAAADDVEAVRLIRTGTLIELGHALGVARALRAGGSAPNSYEAAAALLAERQPALVEQVRKLLRAEREDDAVELLRRRLDAETAVGTPLAVALGRTIAH